MDEQKLTRKWRRALEEKNYNLYDVSANNLYNYYTDKGQYEEALSVYREVARVYKNKENFKMEYGRAERLIGETLITMDNFADALVHVEIYLNIAKAERNKVELQRAYATIGRAHLLHGQSMPDLITGEHPLRSAEKSFLKSLSICKQLTGRNDLKDMEARLYLNLGTTKEYLENYDETEKYLEKALTLCRDNDLFELLHQCYVTTALFVYNKRNDVNKSLRLLNLALSVAERLNKSKVCETLRDKADIFIKMGDFQSARQVLHKAYKLKTPIVSDRETIEKTLKTLAAISKIEDQLIVTDSEDNASKKKLFEKLGDGACSLKNFAKAIEYYLNTLKYAELTFISEKELTPIYVSLYQTYTDLKQYESALEFMWKEFQLVKDTAREAMNTLLVIAELYELSDKSFWDTENIYQRARAECHKMNDLKWEKDIIRKQIALREKNGMHTMVEMLREEASMSGIDLTREDEEEVAEDDARSDDKNTPDIGDDICLDDLSGSESDEEQPKQPRSEIRRRGQTMAIKRNEKGETQLHQACIAGNLAQVRRLLDQGHAVNIRDYAGWMPLHEAANHGFGDIVRLLLERGAPINDKGGKSCDGVTALHDACGNGCLEVVEILLDAGANATLRTDSCETPLETLEKWRERVTELDPSDQMFYDTIRERLMEHLRKVGMNVNDVHQVTPSKLSNRSRTSATSSRTPLKSPITGTSSGQRRRRTPLRRKSINYTSGEESPDETAPVVNHSRGTIDNIIDEEFPSPQHSDDEESSNHYPLLHSPEAGGEAMVSEYRNVMDTLRVRNKLSGQSETHSPLKCLADSNKRGLLDAEEVGENWLEDDMLPTKKRKLLSFNGDTLLNSRPRANNVHTSRISKENTPVADDPIRCNDSDDSIDAFDRLMSNVTSSSSSSLSLKRRTSTKPAARKQKNSLLNAGFVQIIRENSSSATTATTTTPTTDLTNSEYTVSSSQLSDSSCSVSSTPPVPPTPPVVIPTMTSVKVKVNDQLFNVPINKDMVNDLTIGWLAEETARRYYNLKGLQPVLQIRTHDGAIFENSDPLGVTLGMAVESNVLEWILPSILHRYLEACRKFQTVADASIKKTLELIQATHSLSITEQLLDSNSCKAMFKSLHYQSNLEAIDLSNNFIDDDGCKHLAEAMPTMEKLTLLNLSGNHITQLGISYLFAKLNKPNDLLETLILNYNPLTNKSVPFLASIATHLRKLKTLHLCSTHITEFTAVSNFNVAGITDLDISFNHLKVAELRKILRQINSCRIVRLNLAFCVQEPGIGDGIAAFLQTGTLDSLVELNLSGLHLDDGNIFEIVQSLRRAKHLEALYLMDNVLLGGIAFKELLQHLWVQRLYLNGCENLLYNLDVFWDFAETHCDVVYVTVTEKESIKQLDILNKIWQKFHGDCAKIDVNHRKVVLSRCIEAGTSY